MPQTKLAGAGVFGERLRQMVADAMQLTVSCGIAQFQDGDDVRSLLSRADSALYSARAAGGNKQFVHNGAHIRERRDENGRGERPAPPSEPAAPSLASADLQLMTSGELLNH